ncbi:bifunctional folylpolyglutamate synthase/dihydrofolate synthase [Lactobacillus johnsonii]|uniref:tetrahydrofolate synthase n=1 Tax=Lactobacillus johnsonii ATCC 33200 TaxID=525330 RepID=C2E5V4_LACJH|nr:folylpolyglutamate synthase/dihydrofolate synthase family protein [Lactobacillus johnsonii]AXQ18954.1 bifunctional folylpolyglutamate synthase/dihydrofolate synthase [Lactobacillus johnsonii]EEJ59692.1 bifunctional protein FolC [Lactobacillus johnsonii ATCC 33200]KAB1960471.1 bifunctional folylpolyglutamate synthase/dihydrofolate synthase [Lactobacillus johnsonii]KRK54541.1 tetrahydrofolate synthase [Lactobacillus johnsonii ATCC 33200]MCF0083373.1 bifunctional folylpolyglutamate synthase/di
MKFTNVDQVIKRIYSLPKLHPKNDLSYIRRILKQLNNPQDNVKTIHVTGTNGKGSTSYYLSNLLQKAGQKTGLFVSPYIYEFNERIQLNGKNISNNDLIKIANEIETVIEILKKDDPNFSLVTFEYEVALAFQFFVQENCDYAVIEVGIGGEHDKTNVIIPEVSVITTIGLDHEKIIGPTLKDIAEEKSGVIKSNKPVVLGNVPQNVLEILLNKAQSENSKSFLLGRDFQIKIMPDVIEYQDSKNLYNFALRPLVEAYDIGVAVQAIQLLQLDLDRKKIEEAINETHIPGRYDVIQTSPEIIVDGAHNLQAMENLLNLVRKKKKGQIYVLLGMMKDKDLGPVTKLFKDEKVTLTRIDYPRAARLEDFPKEAQKEFEYKENFEEAYTSLKNKLQADDMLLVTGSFYLVGAVLNYCKRGKDES